MPRVFVALLVFAVAVLSLRAGATMEPGLDYFSDASAAIDALVRGDLDGFLATQPLMGSFSLLLRAPFVAPVFHSSLESVYFAGRCLASWRPSCSAWPSPGLPPSAASRRPSRG